MKTQIWAHRGASAYAPENTLEAFQLAIDMHSDGIELDVYLTMDGELAVIHDGTIDRCSNGTGKVTELPFAELRKYDYNYSNVFGDKYKNVKIPNLTEVYDLVYASGITINVELKARGAALIDKLLKCAKEMKMSERIVYSSFWHHNLTDILALEPDAFVAPLYGDNIVNPWMYAKSFGAKALHPAFYDVYFLYDYVAKSHEIGVRVHPWTVDDDENLRKLISLGIDAIITNKPDRALQILNET